ncbi:hypothetical protein FRC05_007335 [Tulasnella sp. 425]|nr:hypothetical protein FRC05_007335 [Tulasnella sp. 425]
MARPDSSLSSRKRSRQTGGSSSGIEPRPVILDSPNPKARKQRKTTPVHEESEEEEDLGLHPQAHPDSATNGPSPSKPGPKRRSQRKQPGGPETSSTPAQKVRNPKAPKTERKTRRQGGSSNTQKSRRKSAPSLPLLADEPEPESEGEDPLLLIGKDEWVPVPWRPSPTNTGIGYVKKEEEEVQVGLDWEGQEPTPDSGAESRASRTGDEFVDMAPHRLAEGGQPESDIGQSVPPVSRSLFAVSPSHDSTSADVRPEAEDSFLSVHPDADSSFVGMEIESDEDVTEFTVPLRLESPPPRRRRSSNVSQREETPGFDLHPGTTSPRHLLGGPENAMEATDQKSARTIFRQLLQSTPAKVNGSRPPAMSRVTPITSFGSQRRALTSSPYPSPRFTGQKLGSLSPEKGVGPSRGVHPKLRALDIQEAAKATNQHNDADSAQQELAIDGPAIHSPSFQVPNKPEFDDLDLEEDDGGLPPQDSPVQGSGDADIRMEEDETDEEELENSLRVERELTEGLSDEDPDPIERHARDPIPDPVPSTPLDEPGSSTPHHAFRLFAESPSSDDGLIPLFDLQPTSASVATPAQPILPPANSMEGQALLPSLELRAPAAPGQSETSDQDTEPESSDDGGPPVVEITSKEPMAAARAAAILKHWHHYSEERAKLRLHRRRSSTTSLNLSTPPIPGRNQPSFMNLLVNRQTGSNASPVPQHVLKMAEAEVLATPPRFLPSVPGHADTQGSKEASLEPRFATPLHRVPSIPEIVINPASSRPSVDEAAYLREEGRPWTKTDWKALENCLLSERRRIAQRFGLQEKQVDVGEVDIDIVVKAFVDQNRLVGDEEEEWDEEGEWDSQQPAGSIVVPGSPLVIPITPQQSRQTTPVGSFVGELAALSGSGQPLKTQRSISPLVPLPTTLLAPRYVHLYEEASAIAGLSSEEHDPNSSGGSTLPRPPHHLPTPSDGLSQEGGIRSGPPSRIPVPLTRDRKPSSVGSQQSQASLPLPPARPTSSGPLPVQTTPSTASRVWGFLGLRGVLRGNSKSIPSPSPAPKQGKPRIPSPSPDSTVAHSPSTTLHIPIKPQVQTEATPDTSRVLKRTASPIPVAQVIIPVSKSKEDLTHIEPTPPRPAPRIPHPKELVALHPVPPKPSEPRMMQPRRSSGGSVKDLVKTFETLESQNAREREGLKNNPVTRRRFGSGPSLRRVASNLSTCSVISADTSDQDRSMDELPSSLSCSPAPHHATPGKSPA